MGVPVFGHLSEALDLEEVEGARFFALADYLARMTDTALTRCSERGRVWREAQVDVEGTAGAWTGPDARTYQEDFRSVASPVEWPAGPKGEDGFHALARLVQVARQVGDSIDRAQLDHRNRVQGTLGWANEGLQRGWTNLQDVVGAESDVDAQRTREAIDETNRAREQAERVVHEQLMVWRRECEAAAGVVDVMITLYRNTLTDTAPALSPIGAPVTGAALAGSVRARVVDSVVAHFGDRRDDPARLAEVWSRLTVEERRAVIERMPDLVDRRLRQRLTGEEVSRLDGILDARLAREAMQTLGVDPDRFDPAQLKGVDAQSEQYRLFLQVVAQRAASADGDPVRAAEYFRALGSEGLRAQLGLLEQGLSQWAGPDGDERARAEIEATIATTASAFASTTGDPDLADLRAELLDARSAWQVHQLAVFLSAPGDRYDPAFLAHAVDTVDAASARLDADTSADRGFQSLGLTDGSGPYPLPHLGRPLYADPVMAVPTAVAFRTLAGNPEASWQYVHRSDGNVDRAHLDRLLRFDTMDEFERALRWQNLHAGGPLPIEGDRLEALAAQNDTTVANALDHALLVHVDDKQNESFHLYVEAIRSTAGADIGPAAKRVLATRLATYIDDLADGAWRQTTANPDMKDQGPPAFADNPTRPELIQFFDHLGADPDAARQVGVNLSAWAEGRTRTVYDPHQQYKDDWKEQVEKMSLMAGVVRNGLEHTADRKREAAAAAKEGTAIATKSGGEAFKAVLKSVGSNLGVPGVAIDVLSKWSTEDTASALGSDSARELKNEASRHQVEGWIINAQVKADISSQVSDMRTAAGLPHDRKSAGLAVNGWNSDSIGDMDEQPAGAHWNPDFAGDHL